MKKKRRAPNALIHRVVGQLAIAEQMRDVCANLLRAGLIRRTLEIAGKIFDGAEVSPMGFFVADCYGLPFNTGLTHASNVALFDFDDLGPVLRHRFRETPQLADEQEELLWNTETDGAWFSIDKYDVLVDEWARFLGVPTDLQSYFREKHGDLFTVDYWEEVQRRIMAGKLHFVLPYPPERRLVKDSADRL